MLKRSIPRLIIALMILTCSGLSRTGAGLRAQNGIGFDYHGFLGMPDTVYSGTLQQVGAILKNYSLTPLVQDTVQLVGYIDTTNGHVPISFPPFDSINLLPGDTLPVFFGINFLDSQMGGHFRIGNNTIVIWPVCYNPNFSTYDSLTATVYVIDTISGLGPEYDLDEGVRCYPVPASGPLFVTSTNPRLRPKSVTIRDASGRIVLVSTTPSFGIETESWADGVYMLEVTFENGSKRVYKVVK